MGGCHGEGGAEENRERVLEAERAQVDQGTKRAEGAEGVERVMGAEGG